jgi:hypothetical protein
MGDMTRPMVYLNPWYGEMCYSGVLLYLHIPSIQQSWQE